MIVGPVEFAQPLWLLLAPFLWLATWWMARRSLSGMTGALRGVAIGARCLVAALIVAALAEPSVRRVSDDMASMVILDVSRSIPRDKVERAERYVEEAARAAGRDDRLGVITVAQEAFVQALATSQTRDVQLTHVGSADATDLASAVRLAVATMPTDAAGRIVLITDGNETKGSLLPAAQAARAAGIPIDVLPIEYTFEREVIFDKLVAPPAARQGQTVNLRFVLTSTHDTRGRVSLLLNGRPVDLDPATDALSAVVDLERGVNAPSVPVDLAFAGAQRFEAVFEPLSEVDDEIPENNSAQGVTFVGSQGRALVYSDDPEGASYAIDAFRSTGFDIEVRPTAQAHGSLIELGAYDAVALINVAAYDLSRKQQEELRAFVHDLGGGLVVIGGENSYGAGGWIGSPLAEAFPVKLDPPQKKNMPRGALALVMHSCEMPNGNYWGKQTALAAVGALSRLDLVSVIEYSWQGGAMEVYPLAEVGDGAGVRRSINNLTFGDMPDFTQSMQVAYNTLFKANAGQKHVIVISDGDPSGPSGALINQFVNAEISISTVAVFPHGGALSQDIVKMRNLAQTTGGAAYQINTLQQAAMLPQIFIKEAQTVKRELIWEGDPISPVREPIPVETLRGLGTAFPPISGFIVTAEREGLSQVTLRAPTEDNDPLLAQWQFGLGRAVAFMSDAGARWAPDWPAWGGFDSFWEQHLRWAMRPSGSSNVRVTTETRGDETYVLVDALDNAGDRLNFALFSGAVVSPDLAAEELSLVQVGPGRYEGRFPTRDAGAYMLTLRYDALGEDGQMERGSVQAAVVRPTADERRALRDNAPLLAQVAELTGGRLLSPDPAGAELFLREGLIAPVSRSPIWLAMAIAALACFVADAGVRRVRIEPAALARLFRRAMRSGEAASERQLDALRAARETAQRGAATRKKVGGAGKAAGGVGAVPVSARKFEASPGAATDLGEGAGSGGAKKPEQQKPAAARDGGDQGADEDGMSRLLRAKRRARGGNGAEDEGEGGGEGQS